ADACGQRADGARCAGPFHTERIGRLRPRFFLDPPRTEVGRPRHGVVHERAGEHLPGLVIGFVLYQRLTQALGDAAHDLSLDQHWVDHGAYIVHHPIADHLRATGLGIDLDLADVTTIGEIAAAGALAGGLIH